MLQMTFHIDIEGQCSSEPAMIWDFDTGERYELVRFPT